jgi:ATP-binding cassette subfamily F protein uup
VLEDFLEKFSGCLLLVSHDRYFMDHLVDQLFIFEGEGAIRVFNGNYSDYREWVEENEMIEEDKPKSVQPKKSEVEDIKEKRKPSFKEKQEYGQLQDEIDTLEKEKKDLMNQFASCETDHDKILKWTERLDQISKNLESKTSRWLELAELIEQ